MKKITPDTLKNYLDSRKGCTFVTLHMITIPEMRKTNNPYYGEIVHLQSRNVTFGANYTNSVNRRLSEVDADSFFVAESLWRGKGERINNYMARHKESGDEYLMYILRTDADGVVLPATYDTYLKWQSGEPVNVAELQPFFPARKPSIKQGVEETGCRETFPRCVKIDGGRLGRYRLGLSSITVDGEQFLIRTDDDIAIARSKK